MDHPFAHRGERLRLNLAKTAPFAIAFAISGCGSLPILEGGQVHIDAKPQAKPALEELSKIDLTYELDPKKYGPCHVNNTSAQGNPAVSARWDTKESGDQVGLNETARLKCALAGFYSRKYFDELTKEEHASLEVSNVTFAYAEKQANRLENLAKKYDQGPSSTDQQQYSSAGVKRKIQEQIISVQMEDLVARVKKARDEAPFLEFQRRRRNRVQSSFLAASDAACDLYKRNLNSVYSTSNFSFGTLATLTGGLGAVVTNADAARALSGTSGITSGVRAEYNDAFFRNKVVEVLTKAMDISRNRKKEEIRRRSAQVVADYSMEDAINDAVLYNGQCSLVAGLQETSESLQIVSDPGLKWLANAFGGAASNSDLTGTLFKSLGQAVGAVQQIQKSTEDQNTVVSPQKDETAVTPTPPAQGPQ